MFALNRATLLACVAAVAFVGLVGAFEVRRCDNNKAIQLAALNVSSCPDKTGDYCAIQLDDLVEFHVKFNTSQSYAGGVFFATLDGKKPDGSWKRISHFQACRNLGLKCPLQAKVAHQFKEYLRASKYLASSSYRVGLADSKLNQLLCLEFPAKVIGAEAAGDFKVAGR